MAETEKRHSHYSYTPRTQKQQIVITRRSTTAPTFSGMGMNSMRMMSSQRSSMGISAGVAGNIAHTGVGEMKNKREGEKKDMQNLNDRLAQYISQVRTLETENKALRDALKKKRKEFDVEPMKEIYQTEIDETKKLLEEANKENAELKVQLASIEDELEDQRSICRLHEERIDQLQDKVNSLNDENAHRTAECDMLRRKVEELEHQVAHWRAKYNELHSQLQALRADLKDETNQRIAEHSRAEALQEELDFLKTITDAEIKEYKAMLSKEDETGINVRDAWSDELTKCMKELREEYEQRLGDISQEMSSRYESQLLQISQHAKSEPSSVVHSKDESRKYRTELSQKDMRIKELEGQLERMRLELNSLHGQLDRVNDELLSEREMRASEVAKLQEEMEAMIRELQMLMDAKLSLELEIAAYRKLLEGEENRLSIGHMTEMVGGYRSESGDALAGILESSSGSSSRMQSSMHGSDSGRITMTRTAKGVLSIHEADNNGRFVAIENTSSHRSKNPVSLKGWKLSRKYIATNFMQEMNIEYFIKNDVVLEGDQVIKIWAKNSEKESGFKKGDISANIDNWGDMSRSSELELIDDKGVVKATLSIKVTF